MREDARELTQAQDAALARVENALAGRVDASEAEKWERALGELKRGAERREALLAKAQDAVRAAADRAEAAEAELRTTKNSPRSPSATTRTRTFAKFEGSARSCCRRSSTPRGPSARRARRTTGGSTSSRSPRTARRTSPRLRRR